MKIALQYLNDTNRNTQAVQLPLSEWKKILSRLKKYEKAFKLRSDLKEALGQIAILKQTKEHKQTLNEFLSEL